MAEEKQYGLDLLSIRGRRFREFLEAATSSSMQQAKVSQ
jgi:hypothetical protein